MIEIMAKILGSMAEPINDIYNLLWKIKAPYLGIGFFIGTSIGLGLKFLNKKIEENEKEIENK